MPRYLLGIDNGGTVAKAALFTFEGREVGVAAMKNATLSSRPDWVEFDAEGLWLAAAASIRAVLAQTGVAPHDIAAVACCGHGNGIYLIDQRGCPTRPGIYSSDARARAITEGWVAAGIDRAIRPKTMQAVWPGQPNALLAWLQQHEPQTVARSRWVLMCKDYIRFRLTGEVRAERTDMSGTSLLNVGTGQYDADLLTACGLGEFQEKLPPLCRSDEICGQVTAAAAEATGLLAGTPVAGGLFDIDACGLASALTDERQLGMVLGTWGCNQYVSRTPVASDAVFMTSCYAIPGHYLMLEGSATSASNLEWFLREFFAAEQQAAREQGGDVYTRINALVSETRPDEAGILFFPFLYGTNAHPDASACLVGLSDRHRRGHVLRAIYEGVVFAHRTHVDRLLAVRARPATIRATGGAARSDVWVQLIADVFQTPVEVPDGSELGALGAALSAAVAIGAYTDYPAACQAMVRFRRRYDPHAALAALYAEKYARYQRLQQALGPAWADLAWRK